MIALDITFLRCYEMVCESTYRQEHRCWRYECIYTERKSHKIKKKKTFGGTQLLSKSQQICEKVNHFLCFGLFQTISLKSFNVIRLCVWVFYHHICIYYLQYIQYSEFLKAHCVRLCFDEFQTLIHNHYFI